MDARNNIATDLFYKIRSRFSGLKLGAETGEITINPEEARFFDFDYMEDTTPMGHVSISLAEPNSMKVYFSHGITETMAPLQKDNWYGFLKELRQFAKRRLLNFDTRDIAKDNLDKRDYAFLSQYSKPAQSSQNTITTSVGESIMSESSLYGTKNMSFQKLMDTRLIIKHSQAVMDDMVPGARSRNISALFVENQEGERFKYPFIHLAGARAMQRHVANGGLPYDDIGKSIVGMSEEIAQLKSFNNYVVRNDLMNSDTNGIVERSAAALNNLREQVKALAKQGHYESYKESFQAHTPEDIPQEVVEQYKEKFTVKSFKEDIASVFPVLYRLMKESDIGYDDIVAMTQSTEDSQEQEVIEASNDPFDQFENWVMELGEPAKPARQKLPRYQWQSQEKDPSHPPAHIKNPETGKLEVNPEWEKWRNSEAGQAAMASQSAHVKDQVEKSKQFRKANEKDFDTTATVMNPHFDQNDDSDDGEPEEIDVGIDYDYNWSGEYRAATWGYHGGEPEEHPDLDIDVKRVVDLETGEDITNDVDMDKIYELLADEIPEPSPDDDYDDSDRYEGTEQEETPKDQGLNVQELAEFIHSFYDKESNSFPKGPEGVCTMVGKKFGERAEHAARKMVERMAPQQSTDQNPELAELARIRELSGM